MNTQRYRVTQKPGEKVTPAVGNILRRRTREEEVKARMDAFNYMQEHHSVLMAYCTWAELISIEVIRMAMEKIIPSLENAGLYRNMVKKKAVALQNAFDKYIGKIYASCYDNDQEAIRKHSDKFETDIFYVMMACKQRMDKSRCRHSLPMAYIAALAGIINTASTLQNNRLAVLRQKNADITYDEAMDPSCLKPYALSLLNELAKQTPDASHVDLGEDENVKIAIKAIAYKIEDMNFVAKVMAEIAKVRTGKDK